jgi:hypothetical protein
LPSAARSLGQNRADKSIGQGIDQSQSVDQVNDVSDCRSSFGNRKIEKAANYYGANLAETSWRDLRIRPQKNGKEAAAKGSVTRERRSSVNI